MKLNELKDTPLSECKLTVGELYQVIKDELEKDQSDELARMVGTRDLKTLLIYFNRSASDIADSL